VKTTPINEFQFPSWENIGEHFSLTCKNHPFLRWLTKHPASRNIHYLGLADGVEVTKENASYGWKECPCPFSDLEVIENADV